VDLLQFIPTEKSIEQIGVFSRAIDESLYKISKQCF